MPKKPHVRRLPRPMGKFTRECFDALRQERDAAKVDAQMFYDGLQRAEERIAALEAENERLKALLREFIDGELHQWRGNCSPDGNGVYCRMHGCLKWPCLVARTRAALSQEPPA